MIFFMLSLLGFSQNSTQMNVVFISVDDLKPTIRSFGDEIAITPNLDFLSRSSTIFLNNHTQQAICSPSRISLLTGMRPDYTQVYDLKTKMRDKRPDILTLPQHFKNNGYKQLESEKFLIQEELITSSTSHHGAFLFKSL